MPLQICCSTFLPFFFYHDDSSLCLRQNSLTFLFFSSARIMLDSMKVIQLSHSLGSIELFMGLMFLIPSLISSLQEQICQYIFHTLIRKGDLLLYTVQLKNSCMVLSRMMSMCKYLSVLYYNFYQILDKSSFHTKK